MEGTLSNDALVDLVGAALAPDVTACTIRRDTIVVGSSVGEAGLFVTEAVVALGLASTGDLRWQVRGLLPSPSLTHAAAAWTDADRTELEHSLGLASCDAATSAIRCVDGAIDDPLATLLAPGTYRWIAAPHVATEGDGSQILSIDAAVRAAVGQYVPGSPRVRTLAEIDRPLRVHSFLALEAFEGVRASTREQLVTLLGAADAASSYGRVRTVVDPARRQLRRHLSEAGLERWAVERLITAFARCTITPSGEAQHKQQTGRAVLANLLERVPSRKDAPQLWDSADEVFFAGAALGLLLPASDTKA